jgi:hypothetical protein
VICWGGGSASRRTQRFWAAPSLLVRLRPIARQAARRSRRPYGLGVSARRVAVVAAILKAPGADPSLARHFATVLATGDQKCVAFLLRHKQRRCASHRPTNIPDLFFHVRTFTVAHELCACHFRHAIRSTPMAQMLRNRPERAVSGTDTVSDAFSMHLSADPAKSCVAMTLHVLLRFFSNFFLRS